MRAGKRYRFLLVEQPESTLPVRYRGPARWPSQSIWLHHSDPMEALIEAFALLARRGEGHDAWAPALSNNPLSFLLDALDEAVLLRDGAGRLLYGNRAAQRLGVDTLGVATAPLEDFQLADQHWRRRRLAFHRGEQTFVIEITCQLR